MGTSNIADKVVVITGASSGIGESTAKLLARHGAKVVLGARRKDRLDAAVKEISTAGGNAISVAVDVTKRAEVEALIRTAIDGFGRVDVIVNNAGIMPWDRWRPSRWRNGIGMIDVNIKGVLIRGGRGLASHAEAEEWSHHQPCFRFRDQSVRAGRDRLLRHEVCCALID